MGGLGGIGLAIDENVLFNNVTESDIMGSEFEDFDKYLPSNTAEFFFASEEGKMPIKLTAKDVNQLHSSYVNIIKSLYNKLKK